MHNQPNSRLPGEGQPATQSAETLDSAALARRRALVQGLGKGGAALAVVAPIQSFAAPKLNTGQVCSLSGLQSGVTSHSPADSNICTGWPPTHFFTGKFATPFDWPTSGPSGPIDPATTTFKDVFGGSDTRRLLDILRLQSSSGVATPPTEDDTNKAYWIAAYFNSLISSNHWVYTPQQVLQQYNLPATRKTQPPGSLDYLDFYINYLSGRTA